MGRPLPLKQRHILEQRKGAAAGEGPARVISERGKWGARSSSPAEDWLDPSGIHGTCIQGDLPDSAPPPLVNDRVRGDQPPNSEALVDQLELQSRMMSRLEALSATDCDLLPPPARPTSDLRPETAPEGERCEFDDGRARARLTASSSAAGLGLCRPHVMDLTAEASRFIDNKCVAAARSAAASCSPSGVALSCSQVGPQLEAKGRGQPLARQPAAGLAHYLDLRRRQLGAWATTAASQSLV